MPTSTFPRNIPVVMHWKTASVVSAVFTTPLDKGTTTFSKVDDEGVLSLTGDVKTFDSVESEEV